MGTAVGGPTAAINGIRTKIIDAKLNLTSGVDLTKSNRSVYKIWSSIQLNQIRKQEPAVFLLAGPYSRPEGWVRLHGVGPRASHRTYVWTAERLVVQMADPFLIQSFAKLETE